MRKFFHRLDLRCAKDAPAPYLPRLRRPIHLHLLCFRFHGRNESGESSPALYNLDGFPVFNPRRNTPEMVAKVCDSCRFHDRKIYHK